VATQIQSFAQGGSAITAKNARIFANFYQFFAIFTNFCKFLRIFTSFSDQLAHLVEISNAFEYFLIRKCVFSYSVYFTQFA
jgi:hypothetical protein